MQTPTGATSRKETEGSMPSRVTSLLPDVRAVGERGPRRGRPPGPGSDGCAEVAWTAAAKRHRRAVRPLAGDSVVLGCNVAGWLQSLSSARLERTWFLISPGSWARLRIPQPALSRAGALSQAVFRSRLPAGCRPRSTARYVLLDE